jgi:hypothetical protein
MVFEASPGLKGILLDFWQRPIPGPRSKENAFSGAPKEGEFSLYIRAYWPKEAITTGAWTPPPVVRVPDRPDRARGPTCRGSQAAGKSKSATPGAPEVADSIGGPSRTRTLDPLIKRRGSAMSRPSVFLRTCPQLRVVSRVLVARVGC